MTYLANNLRALGLRNAALADAVRHAPCETPPTLLASDAPPDALLAQIRALPNPQLLVWCGLGSGATLARYLSAPHPRNRFLVILEPRLATLRAALTAHDWQALLQHPNALWHVGVAPDDLESAFYALFQHPELGAYLRAHAFVAGDTDSAYTAAARQAWATVTQELFRESHAVEVDAPVGFSNVLHNLEHIINTPQLHALKGCCAGRPGILISTGPSLTHTLPALQQVADRAVLFAVDSALRILHTHGLTAHLTGCLERQYLTTNHFRDLDTRHTILVSTPVVHPESYRLYQGPQALLAREHHFLPWLFPGTATHGRAMSSVSHVGLFVLQYLGCSPIYLVGQDLAYDPDTRGSHASGYHLREDETAWQAAGHATCQARSNSGETITTLRWWNQVARFIGYMVREHSTECYNVIPERFGIAIPGTTRLEPDAAWVARFGASFDAHAQLRAKLQNFSTAEREARRQAIFTTLQTTREWLHTCIATSRRLMEDIFTWSIARPPTLERGNTVDAYQRFFQQLEQRTGALMQHPYYATLLGPLVQTRHLDLGQTSVAMLGNDDHDPATREAKLAIPLSWFSEIIVRAHGALHQIDRALTRMAANSPHNTASAPR